MGRINPERRAGIRNAVLGEAKSPGRFKTQQFRVERNVPSAGLGAFDASYSPQTGIMDISTKVALYDKDDLLEDRDEYVDAYRSLIPQYWNDKFVFKCEKDGWEEIEVKPRFRVEIVEEGSAYFIPEITKYKGGDPNAFVSMDASSRSTNPLYPARHGALQDASTSMAIKDGYLNGAVKHFRYFELPIQKTVASTPLALESLTRFCRELTHMVPPLQFPKVKITAIGGDSLRDRKRLRNEAKQFLQNRRVPHQAIDDHHIGPFGLTGSKPVHPARFEQGKLAELKKDTGNQLRLIFEIDEKQLESAINSSADTQSVFRQPTVVHEYGHQLGLPDEYRCMIMQTAQKMADSGLMSPSHVDRWVYAQSLSGFTHKPAAERNMETARVKAIQEKYKDDAPGLKVYEDYMKTLHGTSVLKQQEAFLKICRSAGLTPPPFGQKTASMMSAGTVFHEHHAVTAWECLTRMTKFFVEPNEWSIHLAR